MANIIKFKRVNKTVIDGHTLQEGEIALVPYYDTVGPDGVGLFIGGPVGAKTLLNPVGYTLEETQHATTGFALKTDGVKLVANPERPGYVQVPSSLLPPSENIDLYYVQSFDDLPGDDGIPGSIYYVEDEDEHYICINSHQLDNQRRKYYIPYGRQQQVIDGGEL